MLKTLPLITGDVSKLDPRVFINRGRSYEWLLLDMDYEH